MSQFFGVGNLPSLRALPSAEARMRTFVLLWWNRMPGDGVTAGAVGVLAVLFGSLVGPFSFQVRGCRGGLGETVPQVDWSLLPWVYMTTRTFRPFVSSGVFSRDVCSSVISAGDDDGLHRVG